MKSPFPGMDPYLESYWGDVHTSMITYARDQLRPQLPSGLRAQVQEHVSVQIEDSATHGSYPDLRVVEHAKDDLDRPSQPSAVAVAEPLIIPIVLESETQRSLHIIDSRTGNRVVTAIEILSPSNKTGLVGTSAYRQRQQDLLQGGVNLVEIDLLRAGHYVIAAPMHQVPVPYLGPYRICVIRSWKPDCAEVYRVPLQKRLPIFHIPLRENDADVSLDLQDLIDKSYENGGYDGYIDYRIDPMPSLQGDEAIWADTLLREKR